VTPFVRVALLVMRKDMRVEVRSREIVYTTLFFAVSCVLVFAFALVRDGRALEDAAAGILWIAITFAGTLALGRTFERERHTETLRALMLAPAERPAIYCGKLLGILALLAAVGSCSCRWSRCSFRRRALARSAAHGRSAGDRTTRFAVGALRRDARACPQP
jgi:hypothetical protein